LNIEEISTPDDLKLMMGIDWGGVTAVSHFSLN